MASCLPRKRQRSRSKAGEQGVKTQVNTYALPAGIGAYFLWGLLPLFLHQLAGVGALTIIAHRIVWTLPFAGAFAFLMGRLAGFRISRRTFGMLTISAFLIGLNWLIYVWAVSESRVVEASLGYFINPLLNVALGVFLFNERLSRIQLVALALAALGVLNQTFAVGAFPWVAVGLALTFGFYGYVRKKVDVPAAAGLYWEACILLLPAIVYLAWFGSGGGAVLGGDAKTFWLLVLTGPATAVPLILFAFGARRLNMTTLGILQFIAPTMQFATGIWLGEAFTTAHGITFGLIWAGLAIYTFETISRARGQSALAEAETKVEPT